MTKSQVWEQLETILTPINARGRTPSAQCAFGEFTEQVYLPFYRRKWKRSTILTNEDRVRRHLVAEFEPHTLGGFDRDELQDLLDQKAKAGLSFSTVAHLRWGLKQIFRMAVAEGYIGRNPAELLFTPRECPRPVAREMNIEEVNKGLSVLDLREQVIARLAIVAGMRPGEIFALKWGCLEREHAEVQQRIYRGEVDTPKTIHSVRWAALSDGLVARIRQ